MNTPYRRIKALNEGHILYIPQSEPRFYQKVDGIIYYTDDLEKWKVSTITEIVFRGDHGWKKQKGQNANVVY